MSPRECGFLTGQSSRGSYRKGTEEVEFAPGNSVVKEIEECSCEVRLMNVRSQWAQGHRQRAKITTNLVK